MQHPFINDLSDKSLEDLQTTITDLHKKLNFAYRSQNGAMINQLRMVIESYTVEHTKRMDEIYKKQNIQTQINISGENK